MTSETPPPKFSWTKVLWWLLECAAVVGIFFIYGCGPVPHVNEAHYLCKAKHYWEPSWCHLDLFLSSAEAHWLFYATFGWPTQFLTLAETAWVGRWTGWILLAMSWVYLSRGVWTQRGMSIFTGAAFALLVTYTPMSGEWVIGGIEAKVASYALVIAGLGLIARGRWDFVWPVLGAAAAFHVLVGGWAVVAAMVGWAFAGESRMRLKPMLPWLIGGFVASLPGLIPALLLSFGTDPKVLARANQIYVMERLPHHLVYSKFVPRQVAIHFIAMFVFIVAMFVLFKEKKLRGLLGFGLGAMILAWIGIGINQWTLAQGERELAAGLLRFYWFRMSDACLPMILSVLFPVAWMHVFRNSKQAAWIGAVCLLLLAGIDWTKRIQFELTSPPPAADRQSLAWSQGEHEEKRELIEQWKDTCHWIRENTDPDSLVLTPRNQQTFKWYANRAEVVNWKDVPQDAETLNEWWRRLTEVYDYVALGPLNLTDEGLEDLLRDYGIDYMIVPRNDVLFRERNRFPIQYPRVFPAEGEENAYYIYDVRE